MMKIKHRPLTSEEIAALTKILSIEIENKINLRLKNQITSLWIQQIDDSLYRFCMYPERQRTHNSKKVLALPIETVYLDQDGGIVYVDLFVDEQDSLAEMELWKADGSEIQVYFADANLHVGELKIGAIGDYKLTPKCR